MKYLCVIEQTIAILCKEHSISFEETALDTNSEYMIIELLDEDTGHAQCQACKVMENYH